MIERIQDVSLHLIENDHDNPGWVPERVAESELEGLKTSMQQHGLLQPVGLRPKDEGFTIVWGQRRVLAARSLGWAEIPAIVMDHVLHDEAEALRVIENEQRRGIHPLDQAEAIDRLLKSHKPAEVALMLGESERRVVRLQALLSLPQKAKDWFREGRLDYARAELLLQAPPEAQEELTEEWAGNEWQGMQPLSLCRKDLAKQQVDLKEATWPLDDPWDGLPTCSTCTYATSNDLVLFDEAKESRCTQPVCFEQKQTAVFEAFAAELQHADPDRVLDYKRAKAHRLLHGQDPGYQSHEAIDLDGPAKQLGIEKRTKVWSLCKKLEFDWYWVPFPHEGRWKRLTKARWLEPVLIEAGVCTPKDLGFESEADYKRQQKSREKEAAPADARARAEMEKLKQTNRTLALAYAAVDQLAIGQDEVDAVMQHAADVMLRNADAASVARICRRRKLQKDESVQGFEKERWAAPLRKAMKKPEDWIGLAVELICENDRPHRLSPNIHPNVRSLLKLLGVDLKACATKAKKES